VLSDDERRKKTAKAARQTAKEMIDASEASAKQAAAKAKQAAAKAKKQGKVKVRREAEEQAEAAEAADRLMAEAAADRLMAEAAAKKQVGDDVVDLDESARIIKTWQAITGGKNDITLNDLATYMQSTFEMEKTDSEQSATLAFEGAGLDTDDNMNLEQFRLALGFD
jgi:membrane protein involved in colicin uptake